MRDFMWMIVVIFIILLDRCKESWCYQRKINSRSFHKYGWVDFWKISRELAEEIIMTNATCKVNI